MKSQQSSALPERYRGYKVKDHRFRLTQYGDCWFVSTSDGQRFLCHTRHLSELFDLGCARVIDFVASFKPQSGEDSLEIQVLRMGLQFAKVEWPEYQLGVKCDHFGRNVDPVSNQTSEIPPSIARMLLPGSESQWIWVEVIR